jgi:NAD(P)-dependent dehydrogenase (short-subunit alcohol dehydrogenase family)
MAAAMDAILSAFSRIDVLVNNAGITGNQEAGILHTTPVGEFDKVFAVNVRGIFLGCRAAIPVMLDQGGGVIVNIASVAGLVAFPGRAAYTASKGAVIQLTRAIAADYAGKGIRCNALCPGMIETPMTKWRLDQPNLRRQVLDRIPQDEIGTAAHVADAVMFLAAPDAAYFNGAAIVMDGGYTAI